MWKHSAPRQMVVVSARCQYPSSFVVRQGSVVGVTLGRDGRAPPDQVVVVPLVCKLANPFQSRPPGSVVENLGQVANADISVLAHASCLLSRRRGVLVL